jgi:quercetin dioxygenase-like cupin family protein
MASATGYGLGISQTLRDEIANADARVGQNLVSENELVRIWHIGLAPGERLSFHRHELDYCWIALTSGRSRSMFSDGRMIETEYKAGDCRVFAFGENETMVHDLTNIGDTSLAFTTIEFKGPLSRENS